MEMLGKAERGDEGSELRGEFRFTQRNQVTIAN
jgi:hypothetical protein